MNVPSIIAEVCEALTSALPDWRAVPAGVVRREGPHPPMVVLENVRVGYKTAAAGYHSVAADAVFVASAQDTVDAETVLFDVMSTGEGSVVETVAAIDGTWTDVAIESARMTTRVYGQVEYRAVLVPFELTVPD